MLKSRVCDTRCQNFQKECVRKEELLKTRWFIRNRQRLLDNLGGEKASQKLQALQKQKQKTAEPKVLKKIEEKRALPAWRPTAKDVGFMMPLKPEVENILYVPKIESFVSRKKYFAERYKERPDGRFYYPYCSSWEVGWRLRDYPPPSVSVHGNKSVIQSSFYRRNASSLQRDPDWYRMCQTGDPKNFNEILTY